MIKQAMSKNGLVLAIFAVITTGLISGTYFLTKDKIAEQQERKLRSILQAVVPSDLFDNDIQHNCVLVNAEQYLGTSEPQHAYRATLLGEPAALAIETIAPDGYSGRIKLVIGINTANTITGVRVLTHKETPGLGDKIDLRVSDWVLSFEGTALNEDNRASWAVKKDGGQFDQFTGATITPRAVVEAVERTFEYVQINQQAIFASNKHCNNVSTAKIAVSQQGRSDE